MSLIATLRTVFLQEDVNFLVTNRIPRRLASRFMGWFSRIEHPLVRDASLALWQRFADLRLHEARKAAFRSVHDCFVRELKPDARPFDPDPDVVACPCDAIVGACGVAEDGTVIQAKGFPYGLAELFGDAALAGIHRRSRYVTLRITSSMYHRFHAPHDVHVHEVSYITGDCWNVNPVALRRVERLFCRNERAVVRMRVGLGAHAIVLVPVAAILVAGIRLRFVDVLPRIVRPGRSVIPCDAVLRKGEEMGWFEHGSTIVAFVPRAFALCPGVREGVTIRAGEPLFRIGPGSRADDS
jgi:phosphatidylserine decarboxylase